MSAIEGDQPVGLLTCSCREVDFTTIAISQRVSDSFRKEYSNVVLVEYRLMVEKSSWLYLKLQ